MGVTFIAPQGTYTAPAKLVTKEITENGTYDATDDSANGYSSVTVNVEGGGGSSDFSTAEVTFSMVNTGNLASMPLVVTTESGSPFDALLPTKREVEDGAYTIALYKGKAVVEIEVGALGDTISTSGAIELLESGIYLVTGDCTITIS